MQAARFEEETIVDKNAFKEDTRYTITWRDPEGTLRPANIYVFRLYGKFMIARMTQGDGLLRKIAYEDVAKIVQEKPVDKKDRYFVPAAVLEESAWRDVTIMERYSTSPRLGK